MALKQFFLFPLLAAGSLCAQDLVLDLDDPGYEGGHRSLYGESLAPKLNTQQVDMRMKFGTRSFESVHLNEVLSELRQNIPLTIVSRVDESVLISGEYRVKDWKKLLESLVLEYRLDVYYDVDSKVLLIEQSPDADAQVEVVHVTRDRTIPLDWTQSELLEVLRARSVRLNTISEGNSAFSDYTPFVFKSTSEPLDGE